MVAAKEALMATWDELRARLRRDHSLDVDDPEEVAITFERKGGPQGARQQRVMLRGYKAWGRQMIEVRSAFAEIDDATDPWALLTSNLDTALGAVALHGRYLVLVQRACLDDVTVDGALFLILRLSLLADGLEASAGADRF
jgi:hypothetical protein